MSGGASASAHDLLSNSRQAGNFRGAVCRTEPGKGIVECEDGRRGTDLCCIQADSPSTVKHWFTKPVSWRVAGTGRLHHVGLQ